MTASNQWEASMTKITSSMFLATLLGSCLHPAPAQAQYVRTCVSMAKGNDVNTCHCSQPCRTFARAHDQTFSDGEITVLDPGDYGGLTITKSISINNDSDGEASITVSGGGVIGVRINAPAGTGYVNLRGITIQGIGFGSGQIGVFFTTGFSLTMTNCIVRNLTGDGIVFNPQSSNARLSVSNTLVADNFGTGIFIQPNGSGFSLHASLNRVRAFNNGSHGILLTSGLTGPSTVRVTAANSVAAHNGLSGFRAATVFQTVSFMVVRSVAAYNKTGISADGSAVMRVGQSTVTGNTTSWSATNGGTLRSYGDNNMQGNADFDPSPTTIARK